MMTKTGSYGTESIACPNNTVATTPCGTTAWHNPSSQGKNLPTFEYKFKGVKFQVYGKYDKDHREFALYLDGEFLTNINQYTDGEDVLHALQYESEELPYGEHTIQAKSISNSFAIYKFAYWPSLHAFILNSTEMKPTWNIESDGIGGLREWAHEDNYAGVKKTRKLRFSKIWIYGSEAIKHSDMLFIINGEKIYINLNSTSRIDNKLIYESDYLPLDDYEISFSQHIEECVLHSIFYLPVSPPTPIPISVPISMMTKKGSYELEGSNCPNNVVSKTPCGKTA